MMSASVLDPGPLVDHHMKLEQAPEAYAVYHRREALKNRPDALAPAVHCAQSSERWTAFCHCRYSASRGPLRAGTQRRPSDHRSRRSSRPDQKPTARPAANAPQRRRLGHGRTDDGDPQDIGLELHQQLVGGHPAVHAQLGEGDRGDGPGGIEHFARLPGGRLQDGRARCPARA